jgi:hypothetical protein
MSSTPSLKAFPTTLDKKDRRRQRASGFMGCTKNSSDIPLVLLKLPFVVGISGRFSSLE